MLDSSQDFHLPFRSVLALWKQRVITHQTAKQLASSLGRRGSESSSAAVRMTREPEVVLDAMMISSLPREVRQPELATFRSMSAIEEWQWQYTKFATDGLFRFKPLLLVGRSQTGKTSKALSLFGHAHTLLVSCHGLGTALPSLSEFCRSTHRCIVFDEVSSTQVLANKLVFQAGADPLSVARRPCRSLSDSVCLYGVPMVLCSNVFQLRGTVAAPMAVEDEEYLARNIIKCALAPDELWFEPPAVEIDSISDTEMPISSSG